MNTTQLKELKKRIDDDLSKPLPALGSPEPRHSIILSDADVDTLCFSMSAVMAMLAKSGPMLDKHVKHYGPTMTGLLEKFRSLPE